MDEYCDVFDSHRRSERPAVWDTIRLEKEQILGPEFILIEDLDPSRPGRIFEAKPKHIPGRPSIAIKFIDPASLSSASIGAISAMQEATIGFGLKHPNIVTIHSFGITDANRAFVAMEFVAGQSLEAWLQARHKAGLGEVVAVEIIQVIGSAVAAAYSGEKHLVHRDIKPANILGCPGPDDHGRELDISRLKLADFGLAFHNDGHTGYDSGRDSDHRLPCVGTLGYMPPEQIQFDPNTPVEGSADVYSLAMTLIELATGQLPLTQSERDQVQKAWSDTPDAQKQAESAVQAIRDLYSSLVDPDRMVSRIGDHHLRAILRKAVAVRPADRYRDAAELLSDLTLWQQARPAKQTGVELTFFQKVELFVRRCRRRGGEYEQDQRTFWALCMIPVVVSNTCLSTLATILIQQGVSPKSANSWSAIAAFSFFIACSLAAGRVSCWNTMLSKYTVTIGVMVLGCIIIQHVIIPDDISTKVPTIALVVSVSIVIIGITLFESAFTVGLGILAFVLSVFLKFLMIDPVLQSFGAPILSMLYSAFLGVFIFENWRFPLPQSSVRP